MPQSLRALVAVASIVLAGCAVMQPHVERVAKKLDCDGSRQCTVHVTVSCPRYFACELATDYDLVFVPGKGKAVDIRWTLDGEAGAAFAANGIVFGSSVFECKPEGRAAFACRDTHPDFGIYKYAINVTVNDSVFGPRGVQSLDPWVVNY